MAASRLRGCFKIVAVLVLLIILGIGGLIFSLNEARPTGQAGPDANALAHRMMEASQHTAWQETGAIRWNFGGRQLHLWDRQRMLARVQWADLEVHLDLNDQSGIVRQAGQRLDDDAAAPYLRQAWSHWCNDSFWLNPLDKLFDEGVVRSVVELDEGGQGLLVEYGQGGVTPGDAYLWTLGDDGLPTQWKMWTQILPLQGVKASWDGWTTVETGAKIATRHKILVLDLELTDIAAASDVVALEGADPFAELVAQTQL